MVHSFRRGAALVAVGLALGGCSSLPKGETFPLPFPLTSPVPTTNQEPPKAWGFDCAVQAEGASLKDRDAAQRLQTLGFLILSCWDVAPKDRVGESEPGNNKTVYADTKDGGRLLLTASFANAPAGEEIDIEHMDGLTGVSVQWAPRLGRPENPVIAASLTLTPHGVESGWLDARNGLKDVRVQYEPEGPPHITGDPKPKFLPTAENTLRQIAAETAENTAETALGLMQTHYDQDPTPTFSPLSGQ